jgi:membrane fusion protein, heavy metal efflux system
MKRIIIIINITVLFFACTQQAPKQQGTGPVIQENIVELTNEQYSNAGIETGKLSTQDFFSRIKVNGKIDVPPQSMVSVSVPLGGFLQSTKLLPGMHINKGQVLAVMQDVQYIQLQQDYLTAKAQLALTEVEYNRQKELNQTKASSDKLYEQAKVNYETQQVLIKSLEQKLLLTGLNPSKISVNNISKSINIYSPITGFVSAVNVNVGRYVNPGDVLFELVNPDDIHLTLSVFEKDINKLFIGQKVLAYTNTNSQKKYPCEIILISKNLSQQGAAEIHCHFEQYDKTLLPGMFMNADIEISSKNTDALPDDAIVSYANKKYAFVVIKSNRFQMIEIETGSAGNGYTEIVNTEKIANRPVVTKGAYNLLMALKNNSDE